MCLFAILLLVPDAYCQYTQVSSTPIDVFDNPSFPSTINQTATGLNVSFSNINNSNATVNQADLTVRLHFPNEFKYGFSTPYSINVTFNIVAYSGTNSLSNLFTNSAISLTIDQDHPEAIFFKDFTSVESQLTSFQLSSIVVTPTGVPDCHIYQYVAAINTDYSDR
jgi:hypothetical protein